LAASTIREGQKVVRGKIRLLPAENADRNRAAS
jgi:hypothetical protein